MVIEISIILAYLVWIFIKNSQLGYSPFEAVFLLIDLSMLIQSAVLSAIFVWIKSIREMCKNERLKARILFLMAAILISVVNAMISVDGKADIWTYFLLYSLPVFYCSIISIAATIIIRRHSKK
jgi:hypothetical protein